MKKHKKIEHFRGQLISLPFINKRGQIVAGQESWFLKTEEQQYFIKISAGKLSKELLFNYWDKIIVVEGYISYGLWDTDDPMVQSRIGEYIVLMSILER